MQQFIKYADNQSGNIYLVNTAHILSFEIETGYINARLDDGAEFGLFYICPEAGDDDTDDCPDPLAVALDVQEQFLHFIQIGAHLIDLVKIEADARATCAEPDDDNSDALAACFLAR